jgi:hypothetical protein
MVYYFIQHSMKNKYYEKAAAFGCGFDFVPGAHPRVGAFFIGGKGKWNYEMVFIMIKTRITGMLIFTQRNR